MTLYNFLRLNTNERAEYLWNNGDFFSSKDLSNKNLAFYILNNFYVVVELVKNDIESIKPFKTGVYLDLMVENIEINI